MNSTLLYESTDVLSTYTYRALTQLGNIGMSSAASFYQSVVGFFLVLLANWIVKKVSEESSLFWGDVMHVRKKMRKQGVYSFSDRCIHYTMFVILMLLSFACFYPFLLILSTSFQTQESIYSQGYKVFTDEYTLDTYRLILKNPKCHIISICN